MTNQSYRYPKDEFDAVPEDAPTGVHRAPRSPWRRVVPFVVVAVVVAVVAYVGVTVASGLLDSTPASANGGAGASSPAATTATKAPTKAAEGTTKPTQDDATESSDDATGDADSAVDRSVAVRVLNGAGISGLAGRGADKLSADGFTSVTAADYTGEKLSASTVYYATDEATAQRVASLLGITQVVQADGLKAPVSVVLVSDLP